VRKYELALIVSPSQEIADKEKADIRKLVADSQAKIVSEDDWGIRRLAYSIERKSEGYYAFFQLEAEPERVAELEKQLQLRENLLRFRILRN
jgi:small subunit ribosomal protein S6